VPKRELARDLLETVEAVMESAHGRRDQKRLLETLTWTESMFILDNDPSMIPPLVGFLRDNVFRMCGSDETGLIQMTVALREAILNAMEHGNLELDSSHREINDHTYHRMARERRTQTPYADRHVYVHARESRSEAVYVIRDEGPGFNPSDVPDPTDPANLERESGRGLLLMRSFMDEVQYAPGGNQVTLVKRRDR
jgi:anti-sigma regulatory factor (Ser/Thr protein kinase)